jgi:hypothetical protein
MLKTKTIKIGEFDINIIQFTAFDAVNIRKKLVSVFRNNLPNSENIGMKEMVSLISSMIYEVPVELQLELFKGCSAPDVGGLSTKEAYNTVFEGNLDGTIELALEVLEFNGFFSLNTISILSKKIPMLSPVEKALKGSLTKQMDN